MPKLFTIAATALWVPLLISCERAAQPLPKASQVTPQPVSASAELPAASGSESVDASESADGSESDDAADSADAPPSDGLVVTDTAGADFSKDDLNAVKSVVDARLQLEQFTANGATTQYGKPCRFYDTTSVRKYAGDDVRFAFVRPRMIKISFVGNDHYVRQVNVVAEITRVALLQRGVDGKWHGAVKVARDTLSFLVSSSVQDSTWTVCEKPAHTSGWNAGGTEKPFTPWLPVRAVDTDRMAVVWDESFTTPKLRQLADSVSKLSFTYVVEGNPEPSMPMVFKDICPGEGCEFGEWLTCDTLRVFTAAGDNPKTAFVLHRGDRFTAVTGDVHIKQAGKVAFKRNVKVNDEGMKFYFTPADTLYPLLYEGEGFGTWYFRGKESGGFFFFGNADQESTDIPVVGGVSGYVVLRPIKSEWWVKVRARNGREGWLRPRGSIYGMSPHYEGEMPASCPGERVG
jgi:hypothetical protein